MMPDNLSTSANGMNDILSKEVFHNISFKVEAVTVSFPVILLNISFQRSSASIAPSPKTATLFSSTAVYSGLSISMPSAQEMAKMTKDK